MGLDCDGGSAEFGFGGVELLGSSFAYFCLEPFEISSDVAFFAAAGSSFHSVDYLLEYQFELIFGWIMNVDVVGW